MILIPFLAGCGVTPESWVTLLGGVSVASVAVLGRTPFDAVYSAATGKDCSLVRMEQGKSYCRPEDPPPPAPVFCTRSLGVVDCWQRPDELPWRQRQVADGPTTLTAEQEAYRTRQWPFW
jgi:hypothetical protein